MPNTKLALDGGKRAVTQPLPPMFPGGMRIGAEEEHAVLEVLRSKRLFRYTSLDGSPSTVEALEKAFAARVGVRHCVAVSSGTASLMGGLVALDVGPGDEVIVPAYTWVATAAAVAALGAVPVLAEVDASLTLDPADAERKITPRTKAIVAVHMRGGPCRMDEVMALARRRGLSVLEDAAQANGGSYRGRKLGSIGDAGAFSLQFSKVITCGEGGLITADGERAPRDEVLPGVMLRMSELQGAVALAQLGKLDALVADMRRNRAVLKACVADLAAQRGITFREEPDPDGDAGISLIFFLPEIAQARWVSEALAAEGVPAWAIYDGERDQHVFCDWPPIVNRHRQAEAFPRELCPRTLDLLQRAVHIDISPDLTGAMLEEMADGLEKVLSA